MTLPPITPVTGTAGINAAQSAAPTAAADGFGETINNALQAVSDSEFAADAIAESLAMVDRADIYLGVYAYRYGYVPKKHKISALPPQLIRVGIRSIGGKRTFWMCYLSQMCFFRMRLRQ